MTDVIKSTPLSQLSEAGMCKTSRMVEAKLGGILKKGNLNLLTSSAPISVVTSFKTPCDIKSKKAKMSWNT